MSEGYDGASNFPYIDFVKKYMKKEELSWNCAVCEIKEKGLWVNSKDRKREERRIRREEKKKAKDAEDKPKKKPPAKKKEPKEKTEPKKRTLKVVKEEVEVKEDMTEKITLPNKIRAKVKKTIKDRMDRVDEDKPKKIRGQPKKEREMMGGEDQPAPDKPKPKPKKKRVKLKIVG